MPSRIIISGVVEPETYLRECYIVSFTKEMKISIIFLCVLYAYLLSPANGVPLMSDVQLEKTLADRNIMQGHLRCALGEGPCDPVGRRLRTLAPLVLRGACPQCSPQETRHIRRTLAFVQRNYPWEWAKIVRQYG